MIPVLVVDGDVEDGVDVGDGHVEEAVPVRRHRLVGRVRLHAVVVQLEDDERVGAAAEVRGVQTWKWKMMFARQLPSRFELTS